MEAVFASVSRRHWRVAIRPARPSGDPLPSAGGRGAAALRDRVNPVRTITSPCRVSHTAVHDSRCRPAVAAD